MTEAHHRKKEPDRVRHALLEHAMRLAARQGLGALSVQAVAEAAGVTKGGFFHHFANKKALLDSVFTRMLESLDREIDARMARDPEAQGAFTRAYLETVFEPPEGEPAAPLSLSMLADADLRARWSSWLSDRLLRHRATDGEAVHEVVRLAADGLWLSDLTEAAPLDRSRLRETLLRMTRAGRRPPG